MKNSAAIIPVSSGECQVNSWKSHLKSAFSDAAELLQYLQIDVSDPRMNIDHIPRFKLRVPRPFAAKMKKGQINDPLLLQVLALQQENVDVDGYTSDPLDEQKQQHPGLLHKYYGRVLLLLTGSCAVNCRYCFRRHFPYQEGSQNSSNLQANIDYIRNNTTISEVILSGGDPLIAGDRQIKALVEKLEEIPHLENLRIHSRLPIVIPQRITEQFIEILSTTRLQTSMIIHANHPNEIDDFTGNKLQQLVRSGTTVLNQAVLLKNVNDTGEVLATLNRRLFEFQVLPYYLHLLDPVAGAAHFYQPLEKAISIMTDLRNELPGYLVPKLAIEEPNKQSKTIIC